MSGHQFWLSDTQFARLEPLLPNKPRGVARVDDRRVISRIMHVIRNGLMWRDAPERYGPFKTLYNRVVRWSKAGVFDRYDKHVYRQRNLIERMFGRLKDWRRIATRYGRCANIFMSAITIAATVIFWL
jgi:transposase